MPNAAFRLIIALTTLAFCAPALAQETFSSLEERMTGKELRETGLHKLTDEELAALNEWIRARSLTQEEAVELNRQRRSPDHNTASDTRGARTGETVTEGPIESRLAGHFDGWRGDAVFELENGMVWRQTDSSSLHASDMQNPRVTIKEGLFGAWYLQVEGYNKRVKVERVK